MAPRTVCGCHSRASTTSPKRRGVTLALLWHEYRAEHAQGYAYSWFCERHSDWRKRISATMRQTHLAGEKLFVDWAGDTIPVFDQPFRSDVLEHAIRLSCHQQDPSHALPVAVSIAEINKDFRSGFAR